MTTLYLCDLSHSTKAKNGLQKDIQTLAESLHRRTFFKDDVSALFGRMESNVRELGKQHSRCTAESVHTYPQPNGDIFFYFGNSVNTFCILHFLQFINQE